MWDSPFLLLEYVEGYDKIKCSGQMSLSIRKFVKILMLTLFMMDFTMGYGIGDKNQLADSSRFFSDAISIHWIGLVFHPQGGTYPDLYIRKLDPKAYVVIELGVVLAYEHRIFNRGYIKTVAAYNLDCANVPAGFFHFGFHYQLINRNRHILTAGLGPTLVFRDDWHQFPEYTGDEFFKDKVNGKWQYRLVVFGDIEYSYKISKKFFLNSSVIPGGHLVITFCVGFKYVLD